MSFLQDQMVLLGIFCCIFLMTNDVQCYGSSTSKEGIQLFDGGQHCSGYLRVKYNNTWLYVCHLNFTSQNAFVACRDLECGFPTRYSDTWRELAKTDSSRGIFNCSGQEQHLAECPAAPPDLSSECKPTFLKCSERPEPPDVKTYSWRKADFISGVNLHRGHSYVVMCSINTPFKVQSFVLRVETSEGEITEWRQPAVDNAAYFFLPMKNKLQDYFYHSCKYNYEFQPETFSDEERKTVVFTESSYVRLVGGESRCLGSLELEHDGEWRAVNRQLWSLKEAAVVCRQLHCGSVISTDTRSTEMKNVWRFYSDCDGSETALLGCGNIRNWASSTTVHVLCSDILDPPKISILPHKPDPEISEHVIVHEGHSFLIKCSVKPQFPGGHFSLVFTGDTHSLTVNQTAENHIAAFTFNLSVKADSGNYSCIYHNTVFGHDFSSQSHNITIEVEDADDVLLSEGVSRGFGSSVCLGTLLVKHQSQTLMVTAETLRWDMRHAAIVCRQLGCGSPVSTSKTELPNVTRMWRFLSDCDGSEAALFQCGQVEEWFSSQAITVVCNR